MIDTAFIMFHKCFETLLKNIDDALGYPNYN